MATAPAPVQDEGKATSARRQQVVAYGNYIESQLGRTRNQVKWVEIFSQLVLLVVGVLAALLAIVIVDHWIVPLSTFARWLCLVGLIAGSGLFHCPGNRAAVLAAGECRLCGLGH
jgi:hypothetical protein